MSGTVTPPKAICWNAVAAGLGMLWVGLWGWRSPVAAALCPADLEPRIDAILHQQPAAQRAQWGILIAPLAGGASLVSRDADRFFIPASNIKLLTTAAALHHFGPHHRITTPIYGAVEDDGVTLQILGRGDPSLTTDDLQRLADRVAQQLRQAHTPPVIDRLIVDDTYFWGDRINPNWEWEDLQAGYGTPINSLMLDRNAVSFEVAPQQIGQPLRVQFISPLDAQDWRLSVTAQTVAANAPERLQFIQDGRRQQLHVTGQLRVGSAAEVDAIASPNPTQRSARHFERALQQAGLTVRQTRIPPQPAAPLAQVWATHQSPPLAELITDANANSDNFYADALLYGLGSDRTPPQTPTLPASLEAVETILAALGIDPSGMAQADGSGLARKNLATPTAFVETLQAMHRSPHGQFYRDSLAVAGRSGTLRSRFRHTPVAGRLQGKSGAISGIAALSGYLDPPNHPPLVFSILVNHFDEPVRTIRPTIDAIVEQIAAVEPCP